MTTQDPLSQILERDETIEILARARTHRVALTNQRVVVADENRVALTIAYPALRRVQFDIERDRPATLVIVPESPHDEPQVLAIPPEDYEDVARALVIIGHRLIT